MNVFIGFDQREVAAYAVCRHSIRRRLSVSPPSMVFVQGLILKDLREKGMYERPTEIRDGRMFDVISQHPMATEFAVSRFFIPHLSKGWALFMDCDMLVTTDISRVMEYADPSKAVMVVKHRHEPVNERKMDNQVQSAYSRKNWSSFILWNCEHPANKALTLEMLNSERGLRLHQFCWLEDEQIGELPPTWNFLVGHNQLEPGQVEPPCVIHYTDGGPWFPGYDAVEYAAEWKAEFDRWAA